MAERNLGILLTISLFRQFLAIQSWRRLYRIGYEDFYGRSAGSSDTAGFEGIVFHNQFDLGGEKALSADLSEELV